MERRCFKQHASELLLFGGVYFWNFRASLVDAPLQQQIPLFKSTVGTTSNSLGNLCKPQRRVLLARGSFYAQKLRFASGLSIMKRMQFSKFFEGLK